MTFNRRRKKGSIKLWLCCMLLRVTYSRVANLATETSLGQGRLPNTRPYAPTVSLLDATPPLFHSTKGHLTTLSSQMRAAAAAAAAREWQGRTERRKRRWQQLRCRRQQQQQQQLYRHGLPALVVAAAGSVATTVLVLVLVLLHHCSVPALVLQSLQ